MLCCYINPHTKYEKIANPPHNNHQYFLMVEADFEQKFVRHARTEGCLSLKLEIPSQRDFPDQLVLCPKAKVFFIEFKLQNCRPRKGQKFIHNILRILGFHVYICTNFKEAKEALEIETKIMET